MRAFLSIGFLSYLLIGLAHVIMGSLLPELLTHYGQDYSAGGQLISLQFFGFLAGVLSGPWWSAKLGKRGALQLSLLCLSAAELVFYMLPSWATVLSVAPVAGFGFGMVETIIGALVIQYMEPGRKTVVMTRLEVFFGVGALVMPLLSSLCIASGWWKGSFLLLGLLSLLVLVLWTLLPLGQMSQLMGKQALDRMSGEGKPSLRGASMGLFALFILVFALYVGTEMSVANFLPSILVDNVRAKPEIAALGVTCFWGAMSLGRLFAAKLAEKMGYAGYLIFSCAGGCIVLAGFAMASGITVSFILIALLGLVMSGMFAISLIYANGFFPGLEERMTSVLIASGGIGGATIPLLTGWCMDVMTLQQTLGMLVIFYVIMLGLTVWASRMRKREPQPTATVKAGFSDSRS